MRDDQERSTPPRRRFGWLFLLLMLLFSGAFYLSAKDSVDFAGYWERIRQAVFRSPPPPPAPPAAPNAPTFDIVRAEATGELIAAGKAEPGWRIKLESAAGEVGEAVADVNGEWVIEGRKALPPGEHTLSLRAISPGGGEAVMSGQQIAMSISPRSEPAIVALTEPGKPTRVLQTITRGDASGAASEAAPARPAPPPTPPRETTPAKPEPPRAEAESGTAKTPAVVAKTDASETRAPAADPGAKPSPAPESAKPAEAVEKPPAPLLPPPPVSFSALDYERGAASKLFMTGRSAPGARVMLYANNAFLGIATAGPDGAWTFASPGELPPGSYQIRADHIDQGTGKVLSRAEVSFEQPKPEELDAAPGVAPPASSAAPERPPALAEGDKRPFDTAMAGAAGKTVTERASEKAGPAPVEAAEKRASPARRIAASKRERRAGSRRRCRGVTVRRGDTLWHIARRCYGDGDRYTKIFRSNAGQIRDPNLIYPSQRFVVPR
ncbi:MAG: LysM peptidoglycan-binding domain-containing protein [Hyphomicrobiales bacterium]|nr:LysM peptidoglycan-binding domain-containing protein [Hyphomicrobiales bacterium]